MRNRMSTQLTFAAAVAVLTMGLFAVTSGPVAEPRGVTLAMPTIEGLGLRAILN